MLCCVLFVCLLGESLQAVGLEECLCCVQGCGEQETVAESQLEGAMESVGCQESEASAEKLKQLTSHSGDCSRGVHFLAGGGW